jgi:hypothetical protein
MVIISYFAKAFGLIFDGGFSRRNFTFIITGDGESLKPDDRCKNGEQGADCQEEDGGRFEDLEKKNSIYY